MGTTIAKAEPLRSATAWGGRGRFAGKWVAALAIIASADIIFWQHEWMGSGIGVFAALLLVILFAARGGLFKHRAAWIGGGIAAFYAAALLFDPGPLAFLLFCISMTIVVLLPGAAKGGDGWQWFQRLFFHGIFTVTKPLLDLIHWSRTKSKMRARGVRVKGINLPHIQTILLPLAGSAVFITLFAMANPVLDQMLTSLRLPPLDKTIVGRAIFWTFVFWMSWSLLRPHMLHRVAGTFDGRGDAQIPGVTLQSLTLSLGLFNLIFAAQNMMDIAYLGGFVALPEGMTLAEYAHRGAYPLIVTALLAGLFTLITLRPGSTSARNPLIRRLLVLWIAQNIFLVGSSIERTLDYIRVFSLTELRIAALAWMLLVAIGLALICWRMLKDKSASWLINTNLIASAIILSIFTIVDSSAIAAQWNVRHAQEVGGEGTNLDLCYLTYMGAPALLPLVELEQRTGLDPEFQHRVATVRKSVQQEVQNSQQGEDWTFHNASRLAKAEATVGTVPINFEASDYRCDGSLRPPPPPPPSDAGSQPTS